MILRKFITGVIIRFVLLAILLTVGIAIVGDGNYLFSQIVIFALLLILLAEFLRYITKTNRDLSKFIFAIKHNDFSVNFQAYKLGSAFDELHDSFRDLLEIYRQNKLEKEEQFQFLNGVIERLPVGVLIADDQDQIRLMNSEAQRLLDVPQVGKFTRIDSFVPGLTNRLLSLESDRPSRLEVKKNENTEELDVVRMQIIQESAHNVFIIQDLNARRQDTEMDAWLKLIRILTHEVMNSITSISSLSATSVEMARKSEVDSSLIDALQSIKHRSDAMLRFVNDYRKLTNIPAPKKQWLSLAEIVTEQLNLLKPEFKNRAVAIDLQINEKMKVFADEALFSQTVMNVLLNSMYALESTENAAIKISAVKEGQQTQLSIEDNGSGISISDQNHVFVPFFSTRDEGSGIGLSLCRQIMRAHGGSISFQSKPGETIFSLRLPD